MILIIGGAYQGKVEFAKKLAASQIQEGNPEPKVVANFHLLIKNLMEKGGDPDQYTEEFLAKNPQIVTMDEVGCGIVPMKKEERDYREAVGRAGQRLAMQAETVYRVICGIPVRIK